MAQAKRDIKQTVKKAPRIRIGWYSQKQYEMSGTLCVYRAPNGKDEINVTEVTSQGNPAPSVFIDVKCKGVLGPFIRREEHGVLINLLNQF